MSRVVLGVGIFFGALFASLVALGMSYPQKVVSAAASPHFEGLSPDTWLVDGASFTFPGLATSGNTLILQLESWRPESVGPAALLVEVCGRQNVEVLVENDQAVRIPLGGSCDRLTTTFRIKNPFFGSETDKRALGVQVVSGEVTSPLGIPLVSFSLIFAVALLLSIPPLLLLSVGEKWELSSLIAVAVLGVEAVLLGNASWFSDGYNGAALWLVLTLISLGFVYAWHHDSEAEGRVRARGLTATSRRPVFDSLVPALLLTFVMIVGATFRFYGITFGLPAPFHPDETPKFNAIIGMLSRGDLHPHYFLHPSLLLYSAYFMNKVIILFGPEWEPAATVRLGGRLVSAIAGTASIGVLYVIGKRLFTPFVGLVAASLLAVMPLPITTSRYMKEDVLMLFLILICLYFVIRSIQDEKPWLLLFAGLFAGLSFGTKYSGSLAFPIVAVAPWIRSRSWVPDRAFFTWGAVAGVVAILAFICTTPYSVLDPQAFLAGVSSEQRHMLRGHTVPIDAWSQLWMYHLWRSLLPGTAYFPTIFALFGVGLLLRRRKPEDLLLIGLLLLFYLPAEWVKSKPAPQPERYMVPVLPFLALLAGEALRVLANSKARVLMPIALALLVLAPALKSTLLASEVVDDSRSRMAEWMERELPPGARVAIDYPPYDPPLEGSGFQVLRFAPGKLITRLAEGDLNEEADYLVLSSLVYDRFFTQPDSHASRRAIIRKVFMEVPILHHEESTFGSYGFHNPAVTLFSVKKEDMEARQLARDQGATSSLNDEVRASLNLSPLKFP